MKTEPLVFVGVCDWAGLVRGKAFPDADIGVRLKKGIGADPLQHHDVLLRADFYHPVWHGG